MALLCMAGAGCTTEVVDFPLQAHSSDNGPDTQFLDAGPDTSSWNCTTKVVKQGYRCHYCKHPTTGVTREQCEELECKEKPFSDAGSSGCKYCWWSVYVKDSCTMCWDSSKVLFKDTCHGMDAGR